MSPASSLTNEVSMPFTFDPDYARSFVLRPHQREVLDAIITRSRVGARVLAQVATGGGKTAIASDACARWVASGKRVLVTVKSWEHAAQFASDLVRRHCDLAGQVTFVGPKDAEQYLPGLPRGANGRVVIVTVQSWHSRRKKEFAGETFDCVVIDEAHWGEGGDLFRNLLRDYEGRAALVGMTATPRAWTSFEVLEPRVTMADLIHRGLLARPEVISISSGTTWAAARAGTSTDFTPASLGILGAMPERNDLIARICAVHSEWLGPTLIFTCDIAHAALVVDLLRARGLSAEAYHSGIPGDHRRRLLQAFRNGDMQFLTSVTALTMGVDLPEVRSLILARPTASETLHTQMLGRGARLAPGKSSFRVIDLVDNVETFGDTVVRPHGLFETATLPPLRGPILPSHESAIGDLQAVPMLPGYEELAGIPVGSKGTFGIEFEIGLPDDEPSELREVMWALREALAARIERTATTPLFNHADPRKDNTVWNIEPDPSCGIEVTTRILRGAEGFAEVQDALAAIAPVVEAYGLHVNVRTGTHIHLGGAFDPDRTNWLRDFVVYFEPALLSLVAPSRATSRYCASAFNAREALKRLNGERSWERHFRTTGRYQGLNLTGLFTDRGTIEVRWHSGTLEAPKILSWVGLWQSILAASERQPRLPDDPLLDIRLWPLDGGPGGDVLAMTRFLECDAAFAARLRRRRDHVVGRSWAQNPLYAGTATALLRRWSEADAASATGAP